MALRPLSFNPLFYLEARAGIEPTYANLQYTTVQFCHRLFESKMRHFQGLMVKPQRYCVPRRLGSSLPDFTGFAPAGLRQRVAKRPNFAGFRR